jgi:hypothetical protein
MSTGIYDPTKTGGGNFTRRNYFDVEKDGVSNVYRLLPPFGSLANDGKIAYYWAIHFGFKNSEGKMKPIACIQRKNKEGVVTQACPLCIKLNSLKTAHEAMKLKDPESPMTKELGERLRWLNLDKGYSLNVLATDGKIGVLKLRYKPFKALETLITKLHKEEGVNAVNPGEGVYFDIRRTGTGFQTEYTVEAATLTYKNQDTGRMVKEYKMAVVDDSIIERMEKEAADLPKLYKIFSEEDLALVATGDPTVLDRLFAKPEKKEVGGGFSGGEDGGADEDTEAQAASSQANAVKAAYVAAAPVAAKAEPELTVASTPAPSPAAAAAVLQMSKDEQDLVAQFLNRG